MPRKGYRCISIKEYLQKDLHKVANKLGITIPQFIDLLYNHYDSEPLVINHKDKNPKNNKRSNLELVHPYEAIGV